jgi:outer membrane murein-binding lipoprotein Lpp
MATVKLDGLEIDLPAEAASAVQSYSRDMGRQLQALTTELDELATKLDTLQADFDALAYDKEAAEGRADALEEQLAASGDARIDTAELDQLVAERLATLQRLAPAFTEDFKFDGIDDASLYTQAFENLTGSAPRDDAEPAYIQGVVEGILAARADAEGDEDGDPEDDDSEDADGETKEDADSDRADSTATLRDALKGAGRSTDSPIAAYRSKVTDAWKRPLTATK